VSDSKPLVTEKSVESAWMIGLGCVIAGILLGLVIWYGIGDALYAVCAEFWHFIRTVISAAWQFFGALGPSIWLVLTKILVVIAKILGLLVRCCVVILVVSGVLVIYFWKFQRPLLEQFLQDYEQFSSGH
jgi:hypothetical protein